MTTFGLVMEAYDLKGYLIALGTPNLPVTDTQYDIAAKTGGGTVPSRAEFRQMLQASTCYRQDGIDWNLPTNTRWIGFQRPRFLRLNRMFHRYSMLSRNSSACGWRRRPRLRKCS